MNQYSVNIEWTGNQGSGTFDYRAYKRTHEIHAENKSESIKGSSDPSFLGENQFYNPEELLIAAVSSCFMLWYLSLCSKNGVVVTAYKDRASGKLDRQDGKEKISHIILKPQILITSSSDIKKALELIKTAHDNCYIANSVNIDISHHPTIDHE